MSLQAAFNAAGPSRTIAVDMDDVLTQTNVTVCAMHNEIYGSDMVMNDFQHYLYWQNRCWGPPELTYTKVKELYARGLMQRSPPVEGAKEGLVALKEMGFKLIIITARSESQRPETELWISQYFPDVFDELFFTGAFTDLDKDKPKPATPVKKRSKAEIAQSQSAFLLIDDSLENALSCASHSPPLPVLLFGAYPWNRHFSSSSSPEDMLAYEERVVRGIDTVEGEEMGRRLEGWTGESEGMKLPEGVRRVGGWGEVVDVLKGLRG